MHPNIGINLPDCDSPEQLHGTLTTLRQNGFDSVEINLEMFPLIIGGEICRKWVDILKDELGRHPFLYSAHIGRGLDLRNGKDQKLHREVLHSSLRICRELQLNPLVLHYEEKSKDLQVERHFFDAHKEAADFAGELGITLCIENIEVEHIDPVIDLVAALDRENVRLTLDTGHAYLASRYFHFDFFPAIERMLPYLGHVHLSDNTGCFEELRITDRQAYDALPMGYRREFGRGDIHLPPYYGKIPYDRIFALLKDYRGRFICEYTSDSFLPFNEEIQRQVRQGILAAAQ